MKTTYETDNRFANRGYAPEGATAVYSARWIDMETWGDIVPDRQGMAYDDTRERDVLAKIMNVIPIWKPLPTFVKAFNETHGHEANGVLQAEGALIDGRTVNYHMWRSDPGTKGYIYVEAWLNA